MVLFVVILLQPHWSGLTWRGLQLIILILFCLDKKCAITVSTYCSLLYPIPNVQRGFSLFFNLIMAAAGLWHIAVQLEHLVLRSLLPAEGEHCRFPARSKVRVSHKGTMFPILISCCDYSCISSFRRSHMQRTWQDAHERTSVERASRTSYSTS